VNDPPGPVVRAGIDEPSSGSSVPGSLVRVTGWAFDAAGLLDDVRLAVDNGAGSPVRLGAWRPDVSDAYPSVAHAAASGFEGTVDLRAAGGMAQIRLLVRRGTGPWIQAAATEVEVVPALRERDGARRRAAFTIVHNEALWLGLWLAHYRRFFDADDLFVLDHGSTDHSTSDLAGACHVVPVHREAAFDHHWLKTVVEDFQAFLLRSYDLVLFAEVDEFIVADPIRYSGLDAYLDALDRPAARCLGFNVVHQPDEPPLRFDEPPLRQRRYWHASLEYSKRLISRIPLRWSDGFHLEFNAPDDAPDPSLLLVHLHRADYDTCLARHTASAARDWNQADVDGAAGAQNRIADPQAFDEWFRRGPDLDAPRELIPDHIRELL
jgi:Glycosyl transferase family 2